MSQGDLRDTVHVSVFLYRPMVCACIAAWLSEYVSGPFWCLFILHRSTGRLEAGWIPLSQAKIGMNSNCCPKAGHHAALHTAHDTTHAYQARNPLSRRLLACAAGPRPDARAAPKHADIPCHTTRTTLSVVLPRPAQLGPTNIECIAASYSSRSCLQGLRQRARQLRC